MHDGGDVRGWSRGKYGPHTQTLHQTFYKDFMLFRCNMLSWLCASLKFAQEHIVETLDSTTHQKQTPVQIHVRLTIATPSNTTTGPPQKVDRKDESEKRTTKIATSPLPYLPSRTPSFSLAPVPMATTHAFSSHANLTACGSLSVSPTSSKRGLEPYKVVAGKKIRGARERHVRTRGQPLHVLSSSFLAQGCIDDVQRSERPGIGSYRTGTSAAFFS